MDKYNSVWISCIRRWIIVCNKRRKSGFCKKLSTFYPHNRQNPPKFDKKHTFTQKICLHAIHKNNFFVELSFPARKLLTKQTETGIMQWCSIVSAPLAKLDIASVYGTEGQEFESLTVHQIHQIRTFPSSDFFLFQSNFQFVLCLILPYYSRGDYK